MRKTLIALMLVLPMVFVLVVFSSVKIAGLGVDISVNGITIRSEEANEEGTVVVDMADGRTHTVTAEVSPNNATNKGYTLTSSDPTLVDVTQDGLLVPKREGTAEITATSKDKSFTDTMPVVVMSSKPYDFAFTLYGSDGEELTGSDGEKLLQETEEGYEATLPTGSYTYGMEIAPVGYNEYTLESSGVHAEIEKGAKSIFLPFSGDAELYLTVPGGVNGNVQKTVTLHVTDPSEGGVLINGSEDFGGLRLTTGAKKARLYVQCAGKPTCSSPSATLEKIENTGDGRFILDLDVAETGGEGFKATIRAGGKQFPFIVSFDEFTFSLFSDSMMETTASGGQKVTLLTGNAANFYAVASSGATGVVYDWEFNGPQEYLTKTENGVTVNATESGEEPYILRVTARYGSNDPVTREVTIEIVNKVSVVQIRNSTKADLAGSFTVAGKAYTDALTLTDYAYPLRVYAHSTAGTSEAKATDIDIKTSDESIAIVEGFEEGKPVLVPTGTGTVTVTAEWKGNKAFNSSVSAELTVNVVHDAVAVKNAPELVQATGDGKAVVLLEDIKLGTDAAGKDLTIAQRAEVLKNQRMKSTYNTEWYKNTKDDGITQDSSNISYVLEFKNDVYGNGKSIDADNYTHALDGGGKPLLSLYAGPLYFVKYKQVASVAGQDNCAFLIRTDGVKLYGVNLLGCSDDSLQSTEGGYDLTNLNLTGTTLEINADCEIINCRIRNGRNVVRAYGGNRNGNAYFVDSLSGNPISNEDHIDVEIDGCILSQGREFILKMGANRALRASKANSQEPALRDQSGRAYAETGKSNRYADLSYERDSYFYTRYVMTDLKLKDSVVETSGLFTVGIESNFSGEFLYEGASEHQWRAFTKEWERSGGTSFAAVLRLEGDVRLYDWKDLSLVDSSTLIESPVGQLSAWLKLDIKAMIDHVSAKNPSYNTLIERTSDEKEYVHGGIALYGGGRNYSAVDTSGLNQSLNDLLFLNVNIGVLSDGTGTMQQQGQLLPRAAGTHDFNFYMYTKDSANNYAKQKNDEARGIKYQGVAKRELFPEPTQSA